MRNPLALLAFLILTACGLFSASPRVSTAAERAEANAVVTTFETALLAAEGAGAIKPEKAALAKVDIADIRKLIVDSETVPIGVADLYQRALNLGLKWAIASH